MNDLYDLVFTGEIGDNFSKQEVQNNFRTKLGVSETQLEKLFSGNPVPLKKKISKEKAQSMNLKLLKLGIITVITQDTGNDSFKDRKPAASKRDQKPTSKSSSFELVERIVEPVEQKPPPQVIVYEKQIIEKAAPQPKTDFISAGITWINGIFWIIVGLGFMLAFSPFPDGEVRRGMLLGLILFLIGTFRIWRRNRT